VSEAKYGTGIDFWRDTAASYGREEALGICGRYLGMQLKFEQPDEEHSFCKELFAAIYEAEAGQADFAKIVYPYSFEKANERGDISHYHLSKRSNNDCAHAIDKAISESCYKMYHYNLDIAAMKVVHDYGFSRVNAVLKNHLRQHEYDGRYSQANKEWAQRLGIMETAFKATIMNAHPTLIDGFTNHVRRLYKEVEAERFALAGQPESGTDVHGYEIMRSINFDDNRGFAIGHNAAAVNPYACWQFTIENGKRDFYWGHYFNGAKETEDNYIARIFVLMHDDKVKEIPNPLTAAEMSTEQNYNMIDGRINNEKKRDGFEDAAAKDEIGNATFQTASQDKSSVLEQIRETKKNPPSPRKQKSVRGNDGLEL
jgi:hypothetical protein